MHKSSAAGLKQSSTAVLQVVREWLPSGRACLRLNIDATKVGNVARFFAHSCCGGNLEPVLVRRAGAPLPHVAMFARRGIAPGEELTFMYGEVGGAGGGDVKSGLGRAAPRSCYCGAADCPGVMPAEDV